MCHVSLSASTESHCECSSSNELWLLLSQPRAQPWDGGVALVVSLCSEGCAAVGAECCQLCTVQEVAVQTVSVITAAGVPFCSVGLCVLEIMVG